MCGGARCELYAEVIVLSMRLVPLKLARGSVLAVFYVWPRTMLKLEMYLIRTVYCL